MLEPKEIRRRILQYLLDLRRSGDHHIPNISELSDALHVSSEVIDEQIEILDHYGAIKDGRTFSGDASPLLMPGGVAMLEELNAARRSTMKDSSEMPENELKRQILRYLYERKRTGDIGNPARISDIVESLEVSPEVIDFQIDILSSRPEIV